nr:hypothetical protein [Tanacetum cinerariifolium]
MADENVPAPARTRSDDQILRFAAWVPIGKINFVDQHLRFILLKKISDLECTYYNAYLEMVAKHNRRITAEKEGKKKPTIAKKPKPKPTNEKLSKPAHVPKPKATKEKPTKTLIVMPSKMGKVIKTCKGK